MSTQIAQADEDGRDEQHGRQPRGGRHRAVQGFQLGGCPIDEIHYAAASKARGRGIRSVKATPPSGQLATVTLPASVSAICRTAANTQPDVPR